MPHERCIILSKGLGSSCSTTRAGAHRYSVHGIDSKRPAVPSYFPFSVSVFVSLHLSFNLSIFMIFSFFHSCLSRSAFCLSVRLPFALSASLSHPQYTHECNLPLCFVFKVIESDGIRAWKYWLPKSHNGAESACVRAQGVVHASPKVGVPAFAAQPWSSACRDHASTNPPPCSTRRWSTGYLRHDI